MCLFLLCFLSHHVNELFGMRSCVACGSDWLNHYLTTTLHTLVEYPFNIPVKTFVEANLLFALFTLSFPLRLHTNPHSVEDIGVPGSSPG